MNRDAAQLRDEIRLREASLRDASREREAGELSADQYEEIERREGVALERARNELGELMVSVDTTQKRRRKRRARWLIVAAACFAVVLVYALFSSTLPRQPGNSGDGNIDFTRTQLVDRLLLQAEVDVANKQDTTALSAYAKVLNLEPKNVTALTQTGWLEFTAGSSAGKASVVEFGIKELERAITVAPGQTAPRLYFAMVADATPGNRGVAKAELKVFLKLGPSKAQLAIARQFLGNLGVKIP